MGIASLIGNPLVLAIADFQDEQSMLWSSSALESYLYGVKNAVIYNKDSQLIVVPSKISSHKIDGKEIPFGLFSQPNSEHISAILFSASGTISKFNRIGRQSGLIAPDVIMIRRGTCYNHDPNANLPKMFEYIVDEKSHETWGEGLSMFHNPNAVYPVPEELFPSIAHHHYQDGRIASRVPEFHPFASMTLNIRIKK